MATAADIEESTPTANLSIIDALKGLPLPTVSDGNENSWNIGLSPLGVLIEVLAKVGKSHPTRNAFENTFVRDYVGRILPVVKIYSDFYEENKHKFRDDDKNLDTMLWNFIVKRRIPTRIAKDTYNCRKTLSEANKHITAVCAAIESRLDYFAEKLFGCSLLRITKDSIPTTISWTDKDHNKETTEWMKTTLYPFLINLSVLSFDLTNDVRSYLSRAKKFAVDEQVKKGIVLRRSEDAYVPPHLRRQYSQTVPHIYANPIPFMLVQTPQGPHFMAIPHQIQPIINTKK